MKITGSQAIVKSLEALGVDCIFGYPGGAIMPTYDALHEAKDTIHHVLVRHEQGAVHAAVGYARATEKVGVAIATSGPGATNLITGIADAQIDSVPLVCITGQVFSPLLGTDAFQEADIIGMSVAATKWNYQITDPNEIPEIFKKAFEIASNGRPGAVLIDITKDAQVGMMEYKEAVGNKQGKWLHKPIINMDDILKASEYINNAKKPILITGHGVMLSGAEEAVLKLAEKANVPVVSTLLGLSAFPYNHELYKGMLGMHGNYAANILCNEADVVIAVGMRFDDRVTGDLNHYLPNAKIIHIEIDPSEINKNVKVDIGINADAKEALNALLPYIASNSHPEWHQEFASEHEKEVRAIIKDETMPTDGEIKMAEVINLLSKATNGRAIIVSDVGQHQMIAARYYQFLETNSHISSGGLGTMGFALPAAIGAKMGVKDNRTVVAVIGDGGFQMNIQELAVLNQEEINVKILILNNSFLGMVRQWQELFFESRYSYTKISSPDFVKVAEAYGIQAERVKDRKDLNDALTRFLNSDSSYLLEVMVENQENVFPMVPAGESISNTKLGTER
ncbi:acetolactate synthase large subunit [Francisella tularensis subsp. novicida GA99-3548]|uniref:biosynthetic-type acetolactate synthase large subunit n=1 Tax=Francisella tularensis TaxID=263 RepID=UPI000158B334|nr:biosynthetic-type acetolactate synthase large subunit [Francisella tularensis]AJI73350.1 acetolactate synthase, large subunit, biosynthetic type [Francisella tularensis subsp. novicida D9876]EDN37822.1 acetolactate synthase large subunit [Francisella tularensis subsp. novicida GA99-3548]MBK2111234.1 biosynthetic-type acetolactate synthase large subunit [Francisella tularensis subsp. novicida FSC159]